jgi:hypothetical protein
MMQVEELSMRNAICILVLSVLMAISVLPRSSSAEDLKGKVIMVKGKDVTIRLDDQGYVNQGDIVEISYDAGGIPIPYGTWRVTAVKDDGTLEAEPVEVEDQPPTIDLDAVVHATGTKPVSEAEKLYSQAYTYKYGSEGVEQSQTKFLQLLQEAAEMGHVVAARELGEMYGGISGYQSGYIFSEVNEQTDYDEALKWFLKAATQGDHRSQASLGHFYAMGKGVRADLTEAEKWYRKAWATYESSGDLERARPRFSRHGPLTWYLEYFASDLMRSVSDSKLKAHGMTFEEIDKKVNELHRESARMGCEAAQSYLKRRGLKW